MKRLLPILAAGVLLAGCSGAQEPVGPATSSAPTSTVTTSSSAAPSTTKTSTTRPSPTGTPKVEPVTPAQPVQEQQPAPAPAPVQEEYVAPEQPTFDPNSGDGYGPGQVLPPFCERFPNDPSCAPAPAIDECIGFGCSPEQDAALAEVEGDATARFWDCMAAGGTEETCRQ